MVWIADKPIQIAQFMPTSLHDDGQEFDPSMVIIPPTEQFVSKILFEIPTLAFNLNQEYFKNYVNILCERSAVNSLRLDGTSLLSTYPILNDQQIPGTQYNWLVVPIKPGLHTFTCDTGRFSGIIYGTTREDSYALSLGISLYKTSFIDTTPPIFSHQINCDKIRITASEIAGSNSIGLEEIKVLMDSTFNYTWKIDSLPIDTSTLSIYAEPIDITKNGQIIVETRDKLGYGRQVKFIFNALSLEMRNDIVFKAVNWKDSTCEKVIIKNNGVDTITFLSSAILGDARVNFDGIIPLINQRIAPNDSVFFNVCFKPKNDSTPLTASLLLSLPCSRQISIPISGHVAAPSLMVTNWDFGKVLLGDTACATVYIVNNGNIPISLQKLDLSPLEPTFDFDTVGLFPLSLPAGDSISIRVCYTPNVRRISTVNASVLNSFNLPNNSQIVTGEGVAPLVEDVRIDWGKKRQGTINDSLVILVNKGNYNADLKYITAIGDALSFSSLIQLQLPTSLLPNDTISIPARFIPYQVGVSQSEISISVSNWKLHTPVKITLEGEGILPEVSTVNVDFDTIALRSVKDSTAVVLFTGGNDFLTIDKMMWFSGDSSSFVIDPQYFTARKLPAGVNFSLPIRFLGDSLGDHAATIAVIHDALPAYRRDTSFIELRGVVKNNDTSQFSLDILAPKEIVACTPENIIITIKKYRKPTTTVSENYKQCYE
ncbi:MAG: choice-of-anchor D domain-containing protein [Ignavibacteria bacterium]|nr:choice-of-anchor D domain-containing protein [Ignavibacteria bacterium]